MGSKTRSAHEPHPGEYASEGFLDLVQMDHTKGDVILVDSLRRAHVAQLVRAVGGKHHERHARIERLDHSGQEVRRRRAGSAYQRHGRALRFRHPWLQLNLLTAFVAGAVVVSVAAPVRESVAE